MCDSYRPDGIRHSKTSKANTVTHYWDGQNIIAEANAIGNIRGKYLRGVNLIVQEIDNQSWYHTHNAHGDVVQRIRDNGEAAPVYHYDAFGNEREPNPNDPNPFRYCGEYWDRETESYYLRNRNYNPNIGRFTREDPIRDARNFYIYCGNNPVMFIDPLGLAQKAVRKSPSSKISPIKSSAPPVAKSTPKAPSASVSQVSSSSSQKSSSLKLNNVKIAEVELAKAATKYVYKPMLEMFQESLSSVDLTYSVGVELGATGGISTGAIQAGIAIDTKGNFTVQQTNVIGAMPIGSSYGYSASFTNYNSITNAPNVGQLETSETTSVGMSGQIPAAGPVPVLIGAEAVIMYDEEVEEYYWGITGSGGLGGGYEIHVNHSYTKNLYTVNLFNLAHSVYDFVLEW